MSLTEKFILHWKKNFSSLLPKDTKVVLAVSGGMDSVVMTELFVQAKIPIAIAHANFQLRGEESVRDEKFVEALGAFYQVPVFIQSFDTKTFATQHKLSIQEAARVLRYQWLRELLENQISFALLATAHHANDSIETLLFNFFRGTGIAGLHGILPVQEKIIRPLLFANREEIKFFAIRKNLSWVDDSSNDSDKYTRNYFRHQLIPGLEKVFPAVQENLLENISRIREVEQVYDEAIASYKKKLLIKSGAHWLVSILQLKKLKAHATILWELIKPFHFSAAQLSEVIKLLDAQNGAMVFSSTHRIIKDRKSLIIAPVEALLSGIEVIHEGTKTITTPSGILQIKVAPKTAFNIPTATNMAAIDFSKIVFPLILRPWKKGDYFYPLGMQKKKKIARFFIDRKCSPIDKENALVLENGNQRIIWLVDKRMDDRFKITNTTKKILLLHWKKDI